MGRPKETGTIGYLPINRGTTIILATAAVATLVFIAMSPFASHDMIIEDHELSTTLRFVSQSLVMFVSFGVFFIILLPPGRSKKLQSVFIAGAFMSTGVLTFAHILTCRELLSAVGDTEEPIGSYFHMMSTVVMGIGLAIAAFIPSTRNLRKGGLGTLMAGFLVFTAIMMAIPFILGESLPPLCPHDAPDCPIRISIEYGTIALLVIGSLKYFQLTRRTNDRGFALLGSAAVLAVAGHIAFSMHDNPYDIFSTASVGFAMGCYGLVFMALFRRGVVQPYESLSTTREQSERRRKEAEAATVKAQTYLDFLSHDVANMISPIMNRAEMILRSPNVTEKEKEEAQKIIEQTQKVSSLIVNLRRLSSAEKIDAKTLGPVDLRSLFADLERRKRESHPEIDLKMTTRFSGDEEAKVRGGSVTEDIITEIVDNAIKHAKKNRVEIEVEVYPSKGSSEADDWTVEIKDHGPGIPDQTKKALDVASTDPKRRFTRGIASSLSVVPLIAEQLGGKIRIEDRVPGDYTQGTKVTITLPRAV